MRWCLAAGVLFVGCSSTTTLGAYRVPVQTSDTDVTLKTVLVYTDGAEMVLYETKDAQEFARGRGQIYSETSVSPYRFKIPDRFPLALVVNEGVLEDSTAHPFRKMPLPPLEEGAESVTRVTLSSGSEQRTVVVSGGNIFSEVAETQPLETDLPGPIFALNSVAGTGLWFPAQAETLATWRDAVTSLAPPDPGRASFCVAPLVATMRARTNVDVEVPAGKFKALQVTELIDACQQDQLAEVHVLEIDRWYVAGLGPVKMAYLAGDGLTREYALISSQVTGASNSPWPLEANNRWTYEVRGTDTKVVGGPIDIVVSEVKTVALPKKE
jgi:hypothetical protein